MGHVTVHRSRGPGRGPIRHRGRYRDRVMVGGAGDRGYGHRARAAVVEATVGGSLLVSVVCLGLYLAFRPSAGAVDGWLFDVVAGSHSRAYTAVTHLRSPWVVVAGSVVCGALVWRRDRPRALACVAGPVVAMAVCEEVAKPLVGRTLGAALSYPSGSTVGAAALGCAAVLAAPAAARVPVAVVATAYALWMTVAVTALRWHFPTDALAGLALGVGTVLVADALAWWVSSLPVRPRARVPGRG